MSSSSLAEDFYRLLVNKKASDRTIVTVGRLAVVAVGAVAAVIAGDRTARCSGLVSNAWAGFGAAFAPLMILSPDMEPHDQDRRVARRHRALTVIVDRAWLEFELLWRPGCTK